MLTLKGLPFAPMHRVLATLGHVLYYAYSPKGPAQTRTNIAGVVESVVGVLGQNGLCIFVHSAQSCPLATLRAAVADAVEAKPTRLVADIAREKQLHVVSFTAPYKIYFPPLRPDQWAEAKVPARYRAVRNRTDPRFVVTLELLTFIAQRDLKGMARAGQLGRFVDEVRAQIDADGTFEGLSDHQLMLSRHHAPDLKSRVEAAVQHVEQALDRITREAENTFNRRGRRARTV